MEYNFTFDEKDDDGSPRFHLFVAASCPLASSVAAARTLLRLEDAISMDVADGQSGAGWVFLDGATCSPWKDRGGPFWLHEAYQLADPLCTTQIQLPVLWDTVAQRIVSNDSWEMMKLMSKDASKNGLSVWNDSLGVIAKEGLFPEEMYKQVSLANEAVNGIAVMASRLQNDLLTPSETAGLEFLRNGRREDSPTVVEARKKVVATLEELDNLLGKKRFLLGDYVTGPDVYLGMFLFILDSSYWEAYELRKAEGYKGSVITGDGYANLKGYAREMYRLVQPTVQFESFRQPFRIGQAVEFTRQSYLSTTVGKEALNGDTEALNGDSIEKKELPDLHKIRAVLEKPAGYRRSDPGNQSDQSASTTLKPDRVLCEGITMPFFFRRDSWAIYRNMDLRDDDIILSSGVKMG